MTLKLYGSGSIENVDSIVTSASANISGTELGFLDGINGIGKVLQIVRATDTTQRTTTSTSFIDLPGMSVSITPKLASSKILLIANFFEAHSTGTNNDIRARFQITDSSNVAISGAEDGYLGSINYTTSGQIENQVNLMAYADANDTSTRTYKVRYRVIASSVTVYVQNSNNTGQFYAIEVAA